jgi:hypothetical protein
MRQSLKNTFLSRDKKSAHDDGIGMMFQRKYLKVVHSLLSLLLNMMKGKWVMKQHRKILIHFSHESSSARSLENHLKSSNKS